MYLNIMKVVYNKYLRLDTDTIMYIHGFVDKVYSIVICVMLVALNFPIPEEWQ